MLNYNITPQQGQSGADNLTQQYMQQWLKWWEQQQQLLGRQGQQPQQEQPQQEQPQQEQPQQKGKSSKGAPSYNQQLVAAWGANPHLQAVPSDFGANRALSGYKNLLQQWEQIAAALGSQATAVGFPEETVRTLARSSAKPFATQPLGTFENQMASLKQGAANLKSYLVGRGISLDALPDGLDSLLSILAQLTRQGGS